MGDVSRTYEIRRVPGDLTYPLRQQVLRPHQTLDEVRFRGDDDPETGSFAALTEDGTVVGTATVRRAACPWRPDRSDGWRLRGMATAPERRGQGVGARLLDAVVAHLVRNGGGLLWCHARTPARAFYERAGFTAYGEAWEEPFIGPHIRMWREVPAR